MQVFVNPNDLKALEENIPQMEKLFPSGVDIVPLSSDSVDPGSCIVETKSGQLDARFSTQLQALIGLINHIEVIEPQIEINEEMPVVVELEGTEENIPQETSFVEIEHRNEEELPQSEREVLEKELLEENSLPFISSEQTLPSVPLELEEEAQPSFQKRKRINTEQIPERTKEEAEELDEDMILEYENEEFKEEKEEIKPVNILKPKKSRTEEVSNIASELEENPEWKDVIEEDEV